MRISVMTNLLKICENSIHTRARNTKRLSYLHRSDLPFGQRNDLRGTRSRGRDAALVLTLGRCAGDPLALALQHDFSLKLRNRGDHVEQQATNRLRRIDLRVEHSQSLPTLANLSF